MAKGGKAKGRTKEQIALYAEIVRLMDMLNKRSAEAATVSQKLVEAQARLPEILKQLSEQANQAGRGVRNLGRGQRESAADTKTFLQSLMGLELSLRRIQSGLNGIKKTALFAEKTQKDVLQFAQLARSIDASAEAMKALDQAGRKFGLGFGEASGLIKNMKANLADLRWGGSGGGIGKLMERWGGNFTGYESEKEMLTKLREVYMRVRPEDRIMVSRDIGASDAMQDFLTSDKFKTTADFEKYLDSHKINNWSDAEKAAREGVEQQGNKINAEENKDISVMENLGGLTNETNKILTSIYKYMSDNPWLSAVGLGIQGLGAVGNTAYGIKALADALRIGGTGAAVAGAATAGSAASGAASAGGAVAAGIGLGTFGWIAASLAVLAAGWYAVETISEKMDDNNRGKKEGQSSAEAVKEAEGTVEKAKANLVYQRTHGDQGDIDKAEKELKDARANLADVKTKTAEYDRLVASVKKSMEKIDKGEFVDEQGYADMEKASHFGEFSDMFIKKFNTLDIKGFKQQQVFNAMSSGKYGEGASLIGRLESSKTKAHPFSDENILKDFVISGKAGKVSKDEQALIESYLGQNMTFPQLEKFNSWVKTNKEYGSKTPEWLKKAGEKAFQTQVMGSQASYRGDGQERYLALDQYMGFLKAHKPKEEPRKPQNVFEQAQFEEEESKKKLTEGNPYDVQNLMNPLRGLIDESRQNGLPIPQQGQVGSEGGNLGKVEAASEIQAMEAERKKNLGKVGAVPGVAELEASQQRNLGKVEAASDAMSGDLAKVSDASAIADEAQAVGGVVNNNSTVTNNNNVDAPVNVHNDIHVTQNVSAENAGRSLESVKKQADTWTDMYALNPALKDYAEAGNAFFTPISK